MTAAQKSPPRFAFLLNRAQKVLQRWIETRPAAWDGISAAQVGLLFYLASRQEPATIGAIATGLHVAPAAVTNLSKRMQAADLIERVDDAADGRVTRVRLTAQGQDASRQAHAVLQDLNARLTAGFAPDELAIIARWLTQVAELERDLPRD
jgi:DNA-binding MarR family transcriptional regulator